LVDVTETSPHPADDKHEVITMKADEHFWWTTLLRGFIALTAGSLIIVIPDMARTLLLLPMAMVIAVLGLAVYGILDSVLVFVTSYMTASRPSQIALRFQGIAGIMVGILFIGMFSDFVQLSWFLILIAFQSLIAAIAEFLVARHSKAPSTSHWNFAAAGVAFVFSCVYFYILFGRASQMVPHDISWLIFGYLLAFGIAQCLTAARMLYADQQAGPATRSMQA
jgi:hypothetical protein